MRIAIVQTHVPEFRIAIFSELHRRVQGNLEVWSGEHYFTPTMGSPAQFYPWHRMLRNRFVFHRSLLWQMDHFASSRTADLCIVEFNPRILSTWVLLIARRIAGRKTLMWGHLFPRSGRRSSTRIIRFLMLILSDGVCTYTITEAEQLRELRARIPLLFRGLYISVSPNAIMWARDCRYNHVNSGRRHRILSVGRLIEEKRPDFLLKAFRDALPRLPESIVLNFIGNGPCLGNLQQMVEEMGLAKRVIINGEIYDLKRLKKFYDEAICVVCPGYVGLSATQAFGFGVPMLIADREQHSVEIELCKKDFNCTFFPSDDLKYLTGLIQAFVESPPVWSTHNDEISERIRNSYTFERMSDGFFAMFSDFSLQMAQSGMRKLVVAIAWAGLPHYAARSIAEAIRRHPEYQFIILSSRDHIDNSNAMETVGQGVHWIAAGRQTRWSELGEPVPDVVVLTSWPHVAYQTLALEAKRLKNSCVVSMVDNYLRYTPRQIAGFFYFRLALRRLYNAMWVPGRYSYRFMRFLGVSPENIYEGLYSADSDIFYPPDELSTRDGIVFVGQLIKRKGIDRLAAAWVTRKRMGAEINLRIFGTGLLETEIRECGLHMESFQSPSNLAKIYRGASALILPSVLDHWGVVVHEAAMCGCLLLVTRQCGASADLVQHRVNGYIMKESSVKEILLAIGWLESLTAPEIKLGRQISIDRSRKISPARWANTLDLMIKRYVG